MRSALPPQAPMQRLRSFGGAADGRRLEAVVIMGQGLGWPGAVEAAPDHRGRAWWVARRVPGAGRRIAVDIHPARPGLPFDAPGVGLAGKKAGGVHQEVARFEAFGKPAWPRALRPTNRTTRCPAARGCCSRRKRLSRGFGRCS